MPVILVPMYEDRVVPLTSPSIHVASNLWRPTRSQDLVTHLSDTRYAGTWLSHSDLAPLFYSSESSVQQGVFLLAVEDRKHVLVLSGPCLIYPKQRLALGTSPTRISACLTSRHK